MSEEIGKHKGAVETLLHEKKELSRLLQIVNSQLQKHLGALEEAGVDTDQLIQEIQQGTGQEQKKKTKRKKQGRQKRESRQQKGNSGNQNRQSKDGIEDEEQDADDLLEGENDFSDRDFSPR